jgi:hypothetical protein
LDYSVDTTSPLPQDNVRTEEFPQITAETLKMEKGFCKAVKKHQKELETLRKRHLKVCHSTFHNFPLK